MNGAEKADRGGQTFLTSQNARTWGCPRVGKRKNFCAVMPPITWRRGSVYRWQLAMGGHLWGRAVALVTHLCHLPKLQDCHFSLWVRNLKLQGGEGIVIIICITGGNQNRRRDFSERCHSLGFWLPDHSGDPLGEGFLADGPPAAFSPPTPTLCFPSG